MLSLQDISHIIHISQGNTSINQHCSQKPVQGLGPPGVKPPVFPDVISHETRPTKGHTPVEYTEFAVRLKIGLVYSIKIDRRVSNDYLSLNTFRTFGPQNCLGAINCAPVCITTEQADNKNYTGVINVKR